MYFVRVAKTRCVACLLSLCTDESALTGSNRVTAKPRVQGLRFRVQGLGFRGFRGFGFRA